MVDPEYQKWRIVNLDRCCSELRVGGTKTFLEVIFRDHDWLVLLLARPAFRPEAPRVCLPPLDASRSELGRLDLPPEIIYTIFDHIDAHGDVVALAVTHRLLSVTGWHRLVRIRRARFTLRNWAGDHIIMVGELSESLPEGMALKKVKEVVWDPEHNFFGALRAEGHPAGSKPNSQSPTLNESDDSDYESEVGDCVEFEDSGERSFFWYTDGRYPQIFGYRAEERDWKLYRGKSARSELDNQRANMFYESTAPYYPAASEWALCNSTKKEYVLASTIASIPPWQSGCEARGPFIVQGRDGDLIFDIGALALLLTAWSTDMESLGEPGPWAGDQLAILRVEDIEGEGGKKGWVDVSEKMHERVRQWLTHHQVYLKQNFGL
ncbi:unnamed protein product [Peniophora sp. CBMAI 1063]|nr:unnamed protein product [Peniophora sp. CBMAI 1063]